MKYDTIKIDYEISPTKGESLKRYIRPSLWINNECLSRELTVDMREMIASLKGSGEYAILTCTCGEPGCAGVWENIIVIHWPTTIRWLIPHQGPDRVILNGKENEGILLFKENLFQRTDYFYAVSAAIETAKIMISQNVEGIETVPYGLSVEELLKGIQ